MDWQTFAEASGYRQTPRYDETVRYAKQLAEASSLLKCVSFGKSGEGRELPLLIAASDDAFTPRSARERNKAVVLIQACIHSGEPDGKDAGLALLRDIAVTKLHPHLLNNVIVLFIPIYNADGHERVSPYNRINQQGPDEMGWRGTTTNQNLNRDYMKVDTPETQAWLSLWNHWQPDLFIDCHVTDGADYGSIVTYHFEHHQGIAPSVLAWEREVIQEKVARETQAAGTPISWYLEFIDNRDLKQGMRDFNGSPRFSTGYVPLRNRPAILIETHMLKDYRLRVLGTYDFLRFTLEEVDRDPLRLINAGRMADAKTTSDGNRFDAGHQYPLRFELTDQARPFDLNAVESVTAMSEISGDLWVDFKSQPLKLTVPMYDTFRVTAAVAPPLFYIVPPQWKEVIDVLKAHGLELNRSVSAETVEVESYRFTDVTWASRPFEGRFLTSAKAELIRQKRTFPSGSVLVPLGQPGAKVAINLLEPEAPDSLLVWSFFSAIFEEKEYGEDYILEKLARQMLAESPELQQEFNQALTEPSFASDPRRRLEFFYGRSPYWDPHLNLYPIGRITRPVTFEVEKSI
ncbi:MAG TPA: M14 family metallopeptidase [Pyrinomonadaceae bacterium]|nr:M14 family metallopeptidase [Pyrinomonadaceae bacterium]